MSELDVSSFRFPGITKDLLIALVRKNGGKVELTVDEVDSVGGIMLTINADPLKRTLTLKAVEDKEDAV